MSKTRKITASRKNRREKGIRALPKGSNPHSKGEAFSRSIGERWYMAQEIPRITRAMVRAKVYIINDVSTGNFDGVYKDQRLMGITRYRGEAHN